MRERHPIDELFASALRDAEAPPPPALGAAIMARARRRRHLLWGWRAAAALLLIGGAAWWVMHEGGPRREAALSSAAAGHGGGAPSPPPEARPSEIGMARGPAATEPEAADALTALARAAPGGDEGPVTPRGGGPGLRERAEPWRGMTTSGPEAAGIVLKRPRAAAPPSTRGPGRSGPARSEAGQSRRAAKVSQSAMRPDFSPVTNQRARC
ncbi:MAG: hypothetical protein ACK4L7_01225, partial [Flavobacteriales bacterium]